MTTDGAQPFNITKDQVAGLCKRLRMSPAEVMAVAVEVIARDLENGTTDSRALNHILSEVEQAEKGYPG
jgi:hypothetical protein